MVLLGLLLLAGLVGALVYAAIRARDALLQAVLRRVLLRARVLLPTFCLRSRVSVEGVTLYFDGWEAHAWMAQWPYWPSYVFGCEVDSISGDSFELLVPWRLGQLRIRCGTVVLRGSVPPNHEWMGGRRGAREYLAASRAWRVRHLRHLLDEHLAGGPPYWLRAPPRSRGRLLRALDALVHRVRAEVALTEVLLTSAPIGPASSASVDDSQLVWQRVRKLSAWTEPAGRAGDAMLALVPTIVRIQAEAVELLRAYDSSSPAMRATERATERAAEHALSLIHI